MFRRYFVALLLFLVVAPVVFSQSTMTDEQIVQYVIKENESGTPREQITMNLMKKGVSMEQLRRIQAKYEKQKGGTLLGSKDLTGSSQVKDRLRSNNGGKKKEENYRRSSTKEDIDESTLTEAQRRRLKQRREDEMSQGMDFMLPDSMAMFDEYLSAKKNEKQVFGRNIFNQKNLSFEPNMNVATPVDYRLGPGDVVFVDVWGASQKTMECTVSPDGDITIEGFGPISLSGLTVAQANAKLHSTLGQRYASSKVKLTVGQTKTMAVHVMGEVETPGTYTLSAFATVFHALYMAGGPNQIGTLRDIKVYRNNRLVTTIDVYDYILNGRLSGNVRLTDNDVIVVSPYDCLVNITGKVKRPMYYEMKKAETVGALIKYAGGFMGEAYKKNVRLTRKSEGLMEVYTVGEFEMNQFKLSDGDSIAVDSVLMRFRNMVEIKGAVFRPGKYQLDGSIQTIRQLIKQADGVTEEAFMARGIIHRRKADRTLQVVSFDIKGLLDGTIADIPLQNEDVLFIPSKKEMQDEKILTIQGEVVYPGIYEYADNTTLEDFILQAGGLKDAASVVKIDVARRIRLKKATSIGNQVAQTFSFSLKDGFVIDGDSSFVLEPFDEVYVRRSPGYVEQKHIKIEGEVAFEGTYSIGKKGMRLTDLIKESGGLTKDAYIAGARLERRLTEAERLKQQTMIKLANSGDSVDIRKLELSDVRNVGIYLDKALEHPGSNQWDIILEEGDRLIVPQYSATVTINGEVMYPNTVAFSEGAPLSYYINQAGGYNAKARSSRVFAVHMNGTVTRVKSKKDIKPGCDIVVPSKPKRRGLSMTEILSLGTTTASLGAIIVSLLR